MSTDMKKEEVNGIQIERTKEIEKIKTILNEINDERTVIVGPAYGSSTDKKPDDKLRVYSYGAAILVLSTTDSAKPQMFTGDGWENYSIPHKGVIKYEDLSKKIIEQAIKIAKDKANGKVGDKNYQERSVETLLIKNHLKPAHGTGIIFDMEYNVPKAWYEGIAKWNGKSTRSKPDLIVYDKRDKSFGVIELKLDNDSTSNMGKHFADYYNITHGQHQKEIKEEFRRRIVYLKEYDLIDNISDGDLEEAIQNPLWAAFLFVGKHKEESFKTFSNTKVDPKIDKSEVGYQYVEDYTKDIDFSKEAFWKYLN